MRRPTLVLAACALLLPGSSPPQDEPGPAGVALLKDASYALGVNVGRTCKEQAVELDLDAFEQGLRDGLGGAEPRLTEQQMTEAMLAFQQHLMKKQADLVRVLGERFRKAGRDFLATNAAKPGVEVLPSGLQYEVLEPGSGRRPKPADSVLVDYRGSLTNGLVIDDSAEQGGPVSVALAEVIPGWGEALGLMKVGAKWRIVIPADLAYGADPPPGGVVPPNAVLVYELKLVEIVGK